MANPPTLNEYDALKADHEKLNDAHLKLLESYDAEKKAHIALKAEHEDLKIKFGLAKKAYVWKEGDTKCPPVSVNGVCPECDWHWGSADPHPVSV